jgi:hypothetical protein
MGKGAVRTTGFRRRALFCSLGRCIETDSIAFFVTLQNTGKSFIEIVSQILPSMAAYRMLIARKDFDRPFVISLVDNVLLPALGIQKTKPQKWKSK